MKKVFESDEYKPTTNPTIGNKYHLQWSYTGCVWRLHSISADGVNCVLITPKTKKKISAKISDLRLLKPSAYGYKPE